MISLPQLSGLPPRGKIPASDLCVGDLIMVDGVVTDLILVDHDRIPWVSGLRWSVEPQDMIWVPSITFMTVYGQLGVVHV